MTGRAEDNRVVVLRPERDAARMIASMHGPWRIPTLLKLVDSNTRMGWPEPEPPGRRRSGDPEPG